MNKNKQTLRATFETARQNYTKKDFKTAETLCYKILSIDQNHFESKALLADIFSKTGDFNKAKKLLNEAIDIQPHNVSILNNLGTTCKKLGETKNAIGYYEKVIQIDPNNTNAYYNLHLWLSDNCLLHINILLNLHEYYQEQSRRKQNQVEVPLLFVNNFLLFLILLMHKMLSRDYNWH